MSILVSVVIPLFNSNNTVLEVLESVVNQTYNNFEIIIINDGSTDNSEQLISDYIKEKEEERIRYFYQKNKGVSYARNNGIKKAKGDIIMFLDSDDSWVPNKIERQLEIFKNNSKVGFQGSNRDGIKISYFLGKKFDELNFISPRLLMYKNFFMTSSVAFKKQIFSDSGFFNEKMSFSEDWEYFLRVSTKFNGYLLNDSLVCSVEHKPLYGYSGLSANLWKMEKGELKTLKLGYKLKIVNLFEYVIVVSFSLLKFVRRSLITLIR